MGYPEATADSRAEDIATTAGDGQAPTTAEKPGSHVNKRSKKRSRPAAEGQEAPRTSRKSAPVPTEASVPLCPPSFRLDPKAEELVLSNGGLEAFNEKGYCSARGNYLFTHGSWYYEADAGDFSQKGCARLGWGTNYGDLQANVGFDIFGYAYRSSPPSKVHDASVYPYGRPYGPGDTVGFFIHLPEIDFEPPQLSKEIHVPFLFNSRQREPNPTVKGSYIEFFVNGEPQGKAFEDISYGNYTAAVSLYGGAKILCNFGPNFKYPPKDREFQPLSLLAEVAQKKYESDLKAAKETAQDAAADQMDSTTSDPKQSPKSEHKLENLGFLTHLPTDEEAEKKSDPKVETETAPSNFD